MAPGQGRAERIQMLIARYGPGRAAAGRQFGPLSLSLAVLFLMACAHAPSFDPGGGPARGPREVVERINRNALLVESLRADVRLQSNHIPQSRLSRADLLFARPDRYRVRLRTVFGSTVAVLILCQGQADLYLPASNRLYQGFLTVEQVKGLVGIELPAVDLLEALSGMPTLPPVTELLEYRRIQEDHLLIFPWEQGRREVMVAPDGYRILRDQYRDAAGQVVVEKQFDEHRLVAGVVLPERVRVLLPGRGDALEVQFSHQDVNVSWEQEDFQLDLPGSVERIRLDLEYR